jgi:hypothetical protein
MLNKVKQLDQLFYPSSIAMIGASRDEGRSPFVCVIERRRNRRSNLGELKKEYYGFKGVR